MNAIFEKPFIESHARSSANEHALFSILIPSWNNLPYLKLCIESILNNSTYNHQIIVHVNEGTDGTLEWVKQQPFDYTYSSVNAGVCYAVNAMAKLAKTNYILYLNDDMYVCKLWDKVLFDAAEQKKDHMFYYSGTMIEPDDSGNACAIANKNFGTTVNDFNPIALHDFVGSTHFNNWLGACWPPSLVHKSLWEKVGGYSEEYSPGFYSDPDFAMKLWQIGVRDFRGFGNSLVYHFKCKSTGRVTRNNGRKTFAAKWKIPASYFYKNILRMGEKTNNSPTALKMEKSFTWFIAKIRAWYISNTK